MSIPIHATVRDQDEPASACAQRAPGCTLYLGWGFALARANHGLAQAGASAVGARREGSCTACHRRQDAGGRTNALSPLPFPRALHLPGWLLPWHRTHEPTNHGLQCITDGAAAAASDDRDPAIRWQSRSSTRSHKHRAAPSSTRLPQSQHSCANTIHRPSICVHLLLTGKQPSLETASGIQLATLACLQTTLLWSPPTPCAISFALPFLSPTSTAVRNANQNRQGSTPGHNQGASNPPAARDPGKGTSSSTARRRRPPSPRGLAYPYPPVLCAPMGAGLRRLPRSRYSPTIDFLGVLRTSHKDASWAPAASLLERVPAP
ncbi:hypothetical protein GGTG_00862 [Gaeumannomyces tritici R3-111a-1]|uniref:Uncharacterized protein n=1 Tax=Gaeumannomyces tritici (strain R3-111a-1) TaxID=644352 RepID=J3NHX6_GAET3|nr:hypothetical protein GGTG_00862 [Gaeumannomyces tritici R3-111a-1]EJT80869.1 hypothetical protein GGTG_00862 [Gaeumannomyces tritici R3-111a-1]